MAKTKKPKFEVNLPSRKKKSVKPTTIELMKSKKKLNTNPSPKIAHPHYGPNVFVTIHDADGAASVGYWDKDAKSVQDVVERKPAVIKGKSSVTTHTCQQIIKLAGKEVSATVSYSQGGYGPSNALEDMVIKIDKIVVEDSDDVTSHIEFEFSIV